MSLTRNQKNSWFYDKPACVILCGGKGSRLFPITKYKQKSMIEINGKPILQHVIEYWQKYTNKFIFVVKNHKKKIIELVKTLPIKAEFIEPNEIKGLADGINHIKELVGEKFFVVLGDCICKGEFKLLENMEQWFGVYETDNKEAIARSYSVELNKEKMATKVIEKPQKIPNNLCGMGFYFFDRRIFNYIEKMKDKTDDLTEIIQCMIDLGEKIHPVFFRGHYLNITYPNDLEKAKEILSK